MGSFIFALGSLVLLIPIIYILPLGFTWKGKHIIVATSIGVAGLSLLANMTFDWWQSIGLLVLLVIVSVYIIHNRFAAIIYEVKGLSEEEKRAFAHEDLLQRKREEAAAVVANEDIVQLSHEDGESGSFAQVFSPPETFTEEVETEATGSSPEADDHLLEEIAIDLEEMDEERSEVTDLHLDEMDDTIEVEALQGELAATTLEERESEERLDVEDEFEIEEIISPQEEGSLEQGANELSEIEKMLLGDFDDSIQSPEELLEPLTNAEAIESALDEEEAEDFSFIKEEGPAEEEVRHGQEPGELSEIEKMLLGDFDDSIQEIDVPIDLEESVEEARDEMSLIEEMLRTPLEEMPPLDDETDSILPEEGDYAELFDEISEMEEMEESFFASDEAESDFVAETAIADDVEEEIESSFVESPEDDIMTHTENTKEQLQQQMFVTIHSQVLAAKETLSNSEYEQMVKDCLRPSLSPTHYYTFASLLTQHYLATKSYRKLADHLTELEAQYIDYPLIHAEIVYLQTQIAGKVS